MTYHWRPSWIAASSGDSARRPRARRRRPARWLCLFGPSAAYLKRVWSTTQLNPMSMPPSTRPIATATTTTATVRRVVSSRVGQVTFSQLGDDVADELRHERGRTRERCFSASAAAADSCFLAGRAPVAERGRLRGRLLHERLSAQCAAHSGSFLPDFAVRPVQAAAGAELAQLQPLRVVAAVLRRRVRPLLALGAGERDDLPVFLLRHVASAVSRSGCVRRRDRAARPQCITGGP